MSQRVFSRAQAESELIHALTRQIGYTAGAFSVLRMAGLVDLFDDSNAHQFALVEGLRALGTEAERLSEKYAVDLLSFAGELGIISKVQGHSPPHLRRYIVTDAGVALKAGTHVEHEIVPLVLEHLILENDADAYLTVLRLLELGTAISHENAGAAFLDVVVKMRERRLQWLREVFPSQAVLLRVLKSGVRQVHWLSFDKLGRVKSDIPKGDFGRHHFAPRKSWAVELGHFDATRRALTDRGEDLLNRANWRSMDADRNWIAPPRRFLEFLRLAPSDQLSGTAGPTFELLRPDAATASAMPVDAAILLQTKKFLRSAFPHIKLIHARQAPTSVLRYFLLKVERDEGVRLDFENVLLELAKECKDEFAFFSSRSGRLAYYQVKQ